MKRKIDPATKQGIENSVRAAFNSEQTKRDRQFEEQAKRLLDHLDSFEKGAGNGPAE